MNSWKMMEGRLCSLGLGVLLLTAGGPPASAAGQAAVGADWCERERSGGDRAGFCEVRELTVAPTSGVLAVEAHPNGGISVEGQARGDVHVLARISTSAETDARARQIASAVRIRATLDRIDAEGPSELGNREGWSVNYRLAVPQGLNLSLVAHNGGISVRGLEADLEFRTTNGGVTLAALGGNVRGRTTNGGVNIELDGSSWLGDGLDVATSNGGVQIAVPEHYSALLEASTQNGGLRADLPGMTGRERERPRTLSLQLGSGGAPIRVRTQNGGVRVTRK